jgi:hypothetical protein
MSRGMWPYFKHPVIRGRVDASVIAKSEIRRFAGKQSPPSVVRDCFASHAMAYFGASQCPCETLRLLSTQFPKFGAAFRVALVGQASENFSKPEIQVVDYAGFVMAVREPPLRQESFQNSLLDCFILPVTPIPWSRILFDRRQAKNTSPKLRIGVLRHGILCELGLNSDSYHIGFKISRGIPKRVLQ